MNNNNFDDDDELIDSKEAAKILGLKNHHTLEVWRSTNRYPSLEYVKVGRLVKYTRGILRSFIKENTVCGEG